MRNSVIHLLNASGDVKIAWDPNNEAECAEAREQVEALAAAGYQFFLVDGAPADAVTAGRGTLSCRRVPVETLLPTPAIRDPLPEEESTPPILPETGAAETSRRRGRPPGPRPAVEAVAVRPIRGG